MTQCSSRCWTDSSGKASESSLLVASDSCALSAFGYRVVTSR
jgi:hypothetical protein